MIADRILSMVHAGYRFAFGPLVLAILLGVSSVAWAESPPSSQTDSDEQSSQPFIEDVSPEDVKKFLDPTYMINGFGYSFSANFVAGGGKVYTHKLLPQWAFTHWTAVWADIPIRDFSFPNQEAPSGVGGRHRRLGCGDS